jgi:hypothetical protein
MPHPPTLSPIHYMGGGKVGPGQGDEIDKLVAGGGGEGIRRVRWNCTEFQSPLELVQNREISVATTPAPIQTAA